MAPHPPYRIKTDTLEADRDALAALEHMPHYAPANPAFAHPYLAETLARMEAARSAEKAAQRALDAARDAAATAEWDFHNAMLGAKQQVIAQFGDDSNEIQALGLKKKSERRRPPGRRRAATPDNA